MNEITILKSKNLSVGVIQPNFGQIAGVPKNPRFIKDEKYQKLKKSIQDNPEMLGAREILVYPYEDYYVIIGGNMRYRAAKELGYKELPCKILPADSTPEQLRAITIKDNVQYGQLDWEILANEWEPEELSDWGVDIQDFSFEDSLSEDYSTQDNTVYQPPVPSDEAVTDERYIEQERKVSLSLSDKFIVPPFSVFDTKQGYWQTRKSEWKSLGIQSEVGRAGNLLNYSETILQAQNPKKKLAELLKDSSPNTSSIESKIPNYYFKKEQGLTDEEIIKEFIENSELSGTSIFDPVLCEISYKWFCVPDGRILDPFSGGSVRGIVASKLGYKYTGIELREEQVTENRKQAIEICDSNNIPKYIIGNSENVKSLISSEGIDGGFDMVFTCPPYYDLEKYSDIPDDLSSMSYEEFDEAYERIIINAVDLLAEDSFSVFVVGDVRDEKGAYLDLIGKTIDAHKKAGAVLYNSAILLEPVGTAAMRAARIFNGGRKLCKTHQNVLVFYKGNISNIKNKFSDVVVDDVVSNTPDETGVVSETTDFGEKIVFVSDI